MNVVQLLFHNVILILYCLLKAEGRPFRFGPMVQGSPQSRTPSNEPIINNKDHRGDNIYNPNGKTLNLAHHENDYNHYPDRNQVENQKQFLNVGCPSSNPVVYNALNNKDGSIYSDNRHQNNNMPRNAGWLGDQDSTGISNRGYDQPQTSSEIKNRGYDIPQNPTGMKNIGYVEPQNPAGMKNIGYVESPKLTGINNRGYDLPKTSTGIKNIGYDELQNPAGIKNRAYDGLQNPAGIKNRGYDGLQNPTGMKTRGYDEPQRTTGITNRGYAEPLKPTGMRNLHYDIGPGQNSQYMDKSNDERQKGYTGLFDGY